MAKNLFVTSSARLTAGHASPGLMWTDTSAQVRAATVNVGNQKIAARYINPSRLRIAHRIIALLALATLAASMVSGQDKMLDIFASIFFIAAIIIKVVFESATYRVRQD